jgi:hypothetical protein
VTTVMRDSPSGLLDASGKPAQVAVEETSRALRKDVGPQEALELARGGSRWGNRKAWGEQKGASREASKAVERANRDAVKEAVPETRPLLRRQGQAIESKKALDRMEFREANREPISPFDVVTAAAETAGGRPPILATARHFLWNNKLKMGVWARRLEHAIQTGNTRDAADILGRFGVNAATQAASPAQ